MKYNIYFKKNYSDEYLNPKTIQIKILNFISFITLSSYMDIISDYICFLLE